YTDLQRLAWLHLRDDAVEELAELRHALERHAEAARQHVESASHRALHRVRTLRGDPDRRPRRLDGLRKDRGLGNLEDLAVVGEGPALERLQDDVDRLLPARAAALQLESEALELVVLVAAAETDVHAAAREQIERGDLLGHDQRVMQRHDDDGGAHAQ